MKYYLVDFRIMPPQGSDLQTCRDLLADVAVGAGFESFEDKPEGLTGYVQTSLFDKDALDESIKWFPIEGTRIEYKVEEAEDKDWNEEWEQTGFEPITIGDRCIIYDAKNSEAPQLNNPDELCVGIEAKLAFGTGTHETTRMIVQTLLDMDLEGKSVLACGCGTGILGIVAAKCGAKHVTAYDIDEWSVNNTRHNAQLNGVADIIEALEGDASVLSHVSGLFDVVLANINRSILINDMPHFIDMTHKNSTLILSGFYSSDAPLLVERASALGLKETLRKTNGDWCCLKFVHE